jgi:hypothetical protein
MLALYYLYGPVIALPSLFLLVSFGRILRHYGDSKERGKTTYKKYLLMKKLVTMLLAFVSLICIFDIDPQNWSFWEVATRSAFFGIYAAAWLVSYVLVSFDASRQLETTWLGQRGFWPCSFFINLLLLAVQILFILSDSGTEDYGFYMISRCALDTLLMVLSLVLFYLAVVHPNDFYLTGGLMEIEKQFLSQPTRFIHRQIASFEVRHSLADSKSVQFLSASITDCKAKLAQGLVRFRILVKASDSAHSVLRQYSDFREIHESLRACFSKEQFPNLKLPELPAIASSHMSIDDKIQSLNGYLEAVLIPELLTEGLLDFLGIEGKVRLELAQQHDTALKSLGVVESSPSGVGSYPIEEASAVAFPQPLSKGIFLSVSIGKWGQSADHDGHIDYTLEWKGLDEEQRGTAVRRFNDFFALHKRLKEELSPCQLPPFPSKNYLPNFSKKIDSAAINTRKAALEDYLCLVSNDPAYLTPSVLEFLGWDITLKALWATRVPRFEYVLQTPVTWEGEVDRDESQYTVYLLTIIRKDLHDVGSSLQWKVGRRFREFDKLHSELQNRIKSPLYAQYCAFKGQTVLTNLPPLPGKSLVPVSTYMEIENRRKALQTYFHDLLKLPGITDSYAFSAFIQEPEAGKPHERHPT